jgi:L-threonylcarbamoyladenylate synthase
MTDFTTDIEHCLKTLSEGGVILYPTDTVWGLGCDATNEEAVQKVISIKGKEEKQGLIILLASEREVLKYVTQLDLTVFDYLNETVKPTTVIYEGGTGVAENVLAADGSVAIRITNDEFCRHLIKRFRKPIVSTSANFHGQPTPQTFEFVDDQIKQRVDYIVEHRRDDTQCVSSSSIIKWISGSAPQILRP